MKTQLMITMNDLVFENRNQSYGAYYLRTHYNRIAATATSVAFLLLFLSLTTPTVIKKYFFKPDRENPIYIFGSTPNLMGIIILA